MLARHSGLYLIARGIPGLINFAAIAIYTRLLSPEQYGYYTLVIAGVGLFNVLFFQWLKVSLLRFLPVYEENLEPLLATILFSFLSLTLVTGVLGVASAFLWFDSFWCPFLLLGVLLLWVQAWLELNLEMFRSRLQPGRYGLISGIRAVTALLLGVGFALFGLGAFAPLLALLGAMMLAGFLALRRTFNGIKPQWNLPQLRELLQYGMPLTATFAMAFVINSSDRFLLATFLDEAAAGQYAAAYDLAQQTLTLLMVVVNLAAYPLAVRSLEEKGAEAARAQLRSNGVLLLGIAVPATFGLTLLAPNIASVLLGTEFRTVAVNLLPPIAVAALVAGMKSYYFDLAFQLGRKTSGQFWVLLAAALVNVILNLLWIPLYGIVGAAWATVVGYVVGLLLSILIGQRIFSVPFAWPEFAGIMLGSIVMGAVLVLVRNFTGGIALMAQVVCGVLVYGISTLLLDVAGMRKKAMALMRGRLRWLT